MEEDLHTTLSKYHADSYLANVISKTSLSGLGTSYSAVPPEITSSHC